MKKVILIMLVLMFVPFVSADVIIPGQHGISINNKITNINDFPDYVFISGDLDKGPGIGMCPLKTIENGEIEGYYKFCSISVYAIPKDKFKQEDIEKLNEEMNSTKAQNYLASMDAKEVIKNIVTSTTVADSNPIKEINNYYTVDLTKETEPDDKIITRDYSIYVLLAISLVSLIVIIYIFIRRKTK